MDANTVVREHGPEMLRQVFDNARVATPKKDQKDRKKDSKPAAPVPFSAADLSAMRFPPISFVVPTIIPEGLTLLVSRPKLGKSWLVLDIAVAVACGRFTLGTIKPEQGDVLYLALEDGPRRLQSRMQKIMPLGQEWPKNLYFQTEWSRQDQGGIAALEEWIKAHPAIRLIIVDTLEKFRPKSSGKDSVYTEDYSAVAGLQKLASAHNISVILVHHDRKADAEDPFDTVSGSLGITGAADTIIMLKRRAGGATMHIRGRDLEEAEKTLDFGKANCRWTITGDAAEVNLSDERQAILKVLSDAGDEPVSAKEILLTIGNISRNALDLRLLKMNRDGEIVRVGRGSYALPERSERRKDCPDRSDDSPPPERSERRKDWANDGPKKDPRKDSRKDSRLAQVIDLIDQSANLSDLSDLSGPQSFGSSNLSDDLSDPPSFDPDEGYHDLSHDLSDDLSDDLPEEKPDD